jgi:hypothetical protein
MRGIILVDLSIRRLPPTQASLHTFDYGTHFDACSSEFTGIHSAIGSWSNGGFLHEVFFIGEELKVFIAHTRGFNQLDHFSSRHLPRIGDIVSAKWDPFFPTGKGSGNEFIEMRN